MRQTLTRIKTKVLTLVLTIAAVAVGQTAWAMSSFTVSSPNSNNTFRITRTGNTTVSETIDWRVVSLSAIAGVHFTGYNGNYSGTATFNAGDTYVDVTITEPSSIANVYKYQTDTKRSYRFEVLDKNGDILAMTDRDITSGLTQFSGAKVNKTITNLVTMSNGNFSSGMTSDKYLDVSYTPPTSDVQGSGKTLEGYVLIDDSYDYAQKPAVVSTSTLISSTGAPASYLNTLGYKIYATVCFTEKEKDDGYQYIQIVAGDASHSYDGADSNGTIDNGPTNSVYKVCYELANGSNSEGKAYFPHRGTGSDEFSISTGTLYLQKYKSGYDGNGCVVFDPTVSNITTRFDAGGNDDDTWGYKDFFVRMALRDDTAPNIIGNYVVSSGRHQKGNTFYISIPFNEIVNYRGTTRKLTTSWGDAFYESGDFTNVITFKGTIADDATNSLNITSIIGYVYDLVDNEYTSGISASNLCTLDADYSWSLSDFNQLETNTYEIATKLDLRHLDFLVNDVHNNCSGKTFRQTYNITCDNTHNPIGGFYDPSHYVRFQGTYDGQGHTVSGITVRREETGPIDYGVGLFGYVGPSGSVRNVILANSTFTAHRFVGGIVGHCEGTVENCRVESTVAINAIYKSGTNHGGIAGYISGSICGCISAAAVSRNGKNDCDGFGGIVGFSEHATVKDCLYTGSTVTGTTNIGAIVGKLSANSGTLANNYYTAINLGGVGEESSSSDADGARRGYAVTLGENIALVGDETAYSLSGLTAIATGNYALRSGSTIYSGEGQTLTLSYTNEVPEGYTPVFSATAGTVNGNSLQMPASDVTVSFAGTYNTLYIAHWQAGPDHDGSTAAKAYLITTPAGLTLLASETNGGNPFAGKYFKLDSDIDMSSVDNFTPIGNALSKFFSGNFNGDSHTISHLTINNSSPLHAGLFGRLSGDGLYPDVKNITLDGANISGGEYVGGIVGNLSKGTISNCHVVSSSIRGTDESTPNVGAIIGSFTSVGTNSMSSCTYHSTLAYANSDHGNAFNIGCGYWSINKSRGDAGSARLDATKLFLSDDSDNSALIAAYADPASHTAHDVTKAPDLSSGIAVTLRGRTLTADNWNTLCAPFNLSSTQIESIFGAGTLVKTLSSYANDDNTVTITFASADEIVAGKPYIIMPANHVASPEFSGVTIDNTMCDVGVTGARFKGTYCPTVLTANDKQKLFLANNKLWYPTADVTVRACRAYFELSGDVPELGNNAPNIVIDFGDNDVTEVREVRGVTEVKDDTWFTIDGRKLSGKPTAKGIYINGGHKVVVK